MEMRYTKELLSNLTQRSTSIRQITDKLGIRLTTSNYRYIKNKILKFEIDVSHFCSGFDRRKRIPKLLAKNSATYRLRAETLRNEMVKAGISYNCNRCKNPGEWEGEPLALQVDHIDDDCFNNELMNLQFLCPNCHWLKTKKSHACRTRKALPRSLCVCGE